MPRQSRRARWAKIHEKARQDFDTIYSATLDDREASIEDRLFCDVAGMQWGNDFVDPDDVRPKLELNKVANSVIKIEGDFRNNRLMTTFLPEDGSPSSEAADAMAGVMRADFQASAGDDAIINAFGDEVRGGYGAFFLYAKKAKPHDPDDKTQRICFEPICDPEKSVWWPLDSKRQDKSDALFCFKTTTITPEEYERRYKEDPSSWDAAVMISPTSSWSWYTPDVVIVAELYRIEDGEERWIRFKNVVTGDEIEHRATDFEPDDDSDVAEDGTEIDDDSEGPKLLRRLLMTGYEYGDGGEEGYQKPIRVVKKYTMSGSRILKEERIAGTEIPVVTVYGQRSFIENKERWSGHVRRVKDAQRVLNALTSWLLEFASHSVISVPIFASEQINQHQVTWTEFASGKPKAFLTIDALKDKDGAPVATGPAGGWTKPPELPQPLAAALQFIGVDIKELLGSMEQGEQMVSNISGKAVEMIQRRLEIGNEIYLDNFAKGMKRAGEIYKSMARALYVEPMRKMKTIGEDGRTRGTITLGEAGTTEQGVIKRNGLIDFTAEDFDVVVDVGPSTATKRAAATRELTALLQVMAPEDVKGRTIISRLIMKNVEGEGLGSMNEWADMELLREGVGTPTDEQKAELAKEAAQKDAQPDPAKQAMEQQAQALAANAAKEKALALKAMADSALLEAKRLQTLADVELKRAETVRTVSEIDRAHQPPAEGEPSGRQPVEFLAR